MGAPRGAIFMNKDELFMREAIKLAKRGIGRVSPNPLVGAIIVNNGTTVSKGYHKGPGKPHAEAEAIKRAGKMAEGGTMYVNLEPCSHYGRTPPCVKAIVDAGIKRVVASMQDPNPLVNGNGFKYLSNHGVALSIGILEKEARELNKFYLHFIKEKRPYVIAKMALTLDGFLGDDRRKIIKLTSRNSLKYVHRLRNMVDAILVGVDTVIKDNPFLNIRYIKSKHDPIKVVFDTFLRIPVDANLFKTDGKVIIVTSSNKQFEGANLWKIKQKNGYIDIDAFMERSYREGIQSILVEGGAKIFTSFLNSKFIDEVILFYAPLFLGEGIDSVTEKMKREIKVKKARKIGNDILVEGKVVYRNN